MGETKPSFEEYLESNGTLTYSNVGVSMMPLLKQGRDLFTLVKLKEGERAKKYDTVLYRRPPDRHVLHRVIKVLPDAYVIRGDNCVKKEFGITDADMLAVMTSFVHRGKEHSVTERGYRFYSRFIVFIHPLVSLKLRTRSFLGRVYRRLFKKSASAGSRRGEGGAGVK